MSLFILTWLGIVAIAGALAVGVLCGRPPLRGSCGACAGCAACTGDHGPGRCHAKEAGR